MALWHCARDSVTNLYAEEHNHSKWQQKLITLRRTIYDFFSKFFSLSFSHKRALFLILALFNMQTDFGFAFAVYFGWKSILKCLMVINIIALFTSHINFAIGKSSKITTFLRFKRHFRMAFIVQATNCAFTLVQTRHTLAYSLGGGGI